MSGYWKEFLSTNKRRVCPECGAPMKTQLCYKCKGTGKVKDLFIDHDCESCGGRGTTYVCSLNPSLHRISGETSFSLTQSPKRCRHCGGTGVAKPQWMSGAARCHFCKGTGRAP